MIQILAQTQPTTMAATDLAHIVLPLVPWAIIFLIIIVIFRKSGATKKGQ